MTPRDPQTGDADDDALVRGLRASLRQTEASIDPATLARLRTARREALAPPRTPSRSLLWGGGLGAGAAALVAAWMLPHAFPGASDAPPPASASAVAVPDGEALDAMLDDEDGGDADLDEDAEVMSWLADPGSPG